MAFIDVNAAMCESGFHSVFILPDLWVGGIQSAVKQYLFFQCLMVSISGRVWRFVPTVML